MHLICIRNCSLAVCINNINYGLFVMKNIKFNSPLRNSHRIACRVYFHFCYGINWIHLGYFLHRTTNHRGKKKYWQKFFIANSFLTNLRFSRKLWLHVFCFNFFFNLINYMYINFNEKWVTLTFKNMKIIIRNIIILAEIIMVIKIDARWKLFSDDDAMKNSSYNF